MQTVCILWKYCGRNVLLLTLALFTLFSRPRAEADVSSTKPAQSYSTFGYTDLGDSVEFVFGQQQKITIGGMEIVLQKRINEITSITVAGDFNGWDANASKYQMSKMNDRIFRLRVSKSNLGKKGDLRQFKFVLNHKYWVEPPAEALNKFTGTDGNTNLLIRL